MQTIPNKPIKEFNIKAIRKAIRILNKDTTKYPTGIEMKQSFYDEALEYFTLKGVRCVTSITSFYGLKVVVNDDIEENFKFIY